VSASRRGSLTAAEAAKIAEAADAADRRAVELRAIVAEMEAQTDLLRSGKRDPETADADPPAWRASTQTPESAPATVPQDGTRLALGRRGLAVGRRGLRAPLRVPQRELEDAMPLTGRSGGAPRRSAASRWFSLVNDGGPTADPTRGLNCLDAVLALFDTYCMAARGSAPRTFDAYAHGDPNRPLGGETPGGNASSSRPAAVQNLCPFVGGAEPDLAKRRWTRPCATSPTTCTTRDTARSPSSSPPGHRRLPLLGTVQPAGTILFLTRRCSLSEEVPLYRHHGQTTKANIVSMDALVVDGEGCPAPLPYHGAGQWTAASATVRGPL